MRRRRRPFGEILQRPGRPGWYARFTIDGRRVTRYAGDTQLEARRFLETLHDRLRQGPAAKVKLERFTLAGFLERHGEAYAGRLSASTWQSAKPRIELAAKHFGNRPVAEVTQADADGFLAAQRERGVKEITVRGYQLALSGLWEYAILHRAAAANPWRGMKLGKIDERAVPYVPPAELRRLYAAMPEGIRDLVVILGETGMRRGEALGLRWADVGEDRVTVARSKNGRPRDIPLTALARETLARIRKERVAPLREPDLVFPRSDGGEVSREFRQASRAAGVALRLHDLRHAFASGLVRAGVPLPDVGRLLGHRTIQTTMRYSSHAPEDAAVRAVRALEQSRGQRGASGA